LYPFWWPARVPALITSRPSLPHKPPGSGNKTQHVHQVVEELNNSEVLSKSANVKGRRRLSVMQRCMMEGMAFMSGDSVVVVDVPPPPTVPADVGDLGERNWRENEGNVKVVYNAGRSPAGISQGWKEGSRKVVARLRNEAWWAGCPAGKTWGRKVE